MKANTIPDVVYSVTAPVGETCRVAATVNDVSYTLAVAYDGGQTRFQAVAGEAEISSPRAIVRPLTVTGASGASAAQVAGMVESAIHEFVPAERSTPAGTANATCQYIELDAQHVPQGRLLSVSLRSRNGGNPAAGSYMAVWELGADGVSWSYLGSSTNNPAQTMNTVKTWEFAEEVSLAGRKLRILAQAERSNVWEAGPQLGMRTIPTPDGDGTRCFNNGSGYAFLPELTIAVQQPVARFAPAAHADDAVAHVSQQEREAWNAKADAAALDERIAALSQQMVMHAQNTKSHVFAAEHEFLAGLREGSQAGAVPVLFVEGTQGAPLLAIRGNETNVSVTGSQLSFNVPRLTVMSDCPALYSYDADTGASDVWFAGASDSLLLAPLGLTEPGTYAGAPSLPLFLRGSVLSFNGTEIDVAALAELLAHKDELLALLNAGQA